MISNDSLHIIGQNEPELKKYYVYELIDPATNNVFYVGHGQNERIDYHNSSEKSEKGNLINKIEESGQAHLKIIIGRFDTKEEATAVESVLIKWIYGKSALTNVVHGHRHYYVRSNHEKSIKQYTHIEGIDIIRKIPGLRDGTYTANQLKLIHENSIYEKLSDIINYLTQDKTFSHLKFSDPDFSDPSNPKIVIYNFDDCINLQLKMQLTGKKVILTFVPSNKDKFSLEAYYQSMLESDPPFSPRNPKTGRMYVHVDRDAKKSAKFSDGVLYDNVDEIKKYIFYALNRLSINR